MKYCGLNTCDVANGEGIRLSLFVSGCNFHCPGCFNKASQDFNYGVDYTEHTRQDILSLLESPNLNGLSILGGDPLWQNSAGLLELTKLCDGVHKLGKNVWIWSGFTWEQVMVGKPMGQMTIEEYLAMNLIKSCDVWIDGLFEQDKKDTSLAWRGSSNQRVIDVKKSLEKGEVVNYEAKGNA